MIALDNVMHTWGIFTTAAKNPISFGREDCVGGFKDWMELSVVPSWCDVSGLLVTWEVSGSGGIISAT